MGVLEQNKKSRLLLGQDNNVLTWLVIVNAVAFVIISFIQIIYRTSDIPIERFYTEIMNWLTVSADPGVLLARPWTILTHMFVQEHLLDLLGSLLWLWAFGYIMQDLAGSQKLVPLYLYGGLAGVLFFELSVNLIPGLHGKALTALAGPGAALMAIAVGATSFAPKYRLFTALNGGIPLWVLLVIFIAVDYAGISGSNPAVALAHAGGGLTGFLFVYQLHRGRDYGIWMSRGVQKLDNLFNPDKKHLPTSSSQTHFYKATRAPYQKTSHVTQQRVDDLLDKINQMGYARLTDEEKAFLKRASEEQDTPH